MDKRAEMGIGTLIIFIALLLVAAIAAGVLIQTAGSLQEKALTTGDQAKGQIATNVRVIEVSGTDGRNGTLKDFNYISKLAAGSEAIKLSQAIFTVNTFDRTATLQYAGTDAGLANNISGYYTLDIETVDMNGTTGNDYDKDGVVENITGGPNATVASINMSGSPGVELGSCVDGSFSSSLSNTTYIESVTGTCSVNETLSVTITPVNKSSGYFAVEYLQTGSNWVDGNLQRGDVIKIYFEGPKEITEDEKVRLNFIPKIGTPTLTEFITPEVISEERIYLYP